VAAGYDGSIKIDTSINSTGFNKGVGGIMSGLKGIAAAVGIAFGIGVIVRFMKSCAEAASAMDIMKNRFRGVFGAEANYAESQLSDLGKKINMADDDLMSLAATLQNAAIALGFTGMNAADMSLKLTALTEDLATFYGTTDVEMAQMLMMGMQGMTRGLKQLGISITEADIKNKALTLGLYSGAGAISATARASSILALIVDKTAAAQGNAEKTAHTWAGEIRGLVGAWGQLKEAIGYSLIIFAPVIAVITRIIKWLTTLATYFSMVMSLLFGIKIDIGAVTGGLDDAAGAADDLADNTAAAGKAAKGALAAFDELNVLQQEQGAGGAGGGGGGAIVVPSLTIPPIDTSELDKMWAKAKIIADLIKEYWNHPWETLKRWAGEVWANISGLAKQAWDIIKQVWGIAMQWMYDHVTKPIEDFFTNLWTNVQEMPGRAWDKLVLAWSGAMLWMYDHVTKPIDDLFSTAWENIKQWASDAWDGIVKIWTVVSAWFNDNIVKPVVAWFKQAWEDIKGFFSSAWTTISTAWSIVSTWFNDNVIIPVTGWFKQAWIDIQGFFSGAWTAISTAWNTVATWFNDNVITPLSTFFSTAWINIKGFFSEAWTTISGIWITVSAWFQTNVIDPIKTGWNTFWNGVGPALQTVWDGIKTVVKSGVNGVIGFINGLISAVVSGINSLIGALNNLSFTMPSWLGGGKFGLSIPLISAPQIPLLAKGAVIPPNAAFAAILGDQRGYRNLEAPEPLFRQMLDEAVSRGAASGDIHVHFG
jgi:hypothetical protein